jgi:hypothetical protein
MLLLVYKTKCTNHPFFGTNVFSHGIFPTGYLSISSVGLASMIAPEVHNDLQAITLLININMDKVFQTSEQK